MCVNLRTFLLSATKECFKPCDSLIYFTIFIYCLFHFFSVPAWQFDNYKGNPISAAYLC